MHSEILSNEQVSELKEIVGQAKTFTGLDLQPMPFYKPWKNEEENYIRVQHEGESCYLPKTQLGVDHQGNDNVIEKLKNQWASPYEARGLRFENLNGDQNELLKAAFGNSLSVKHDKNKDIYSATLFTHIDKKGVVEQALERGLTVAGAAIAAPGAAIAATALAATKFLPGVVAGAGLIVGNAAVLGITAGAVASLSIGGAMTQAPKLLDKLSDKLNGDEREFAIQYIDSKFSGEKMGMFTQVAKDVPMISITNEEIKNTGSASRMISLFGIGNAGTELDKKRASAPSA